MILCSKPTFMVVVSVIIIIIIVIVIIFFRQSSLEYNFICCLRKVHRVCRKSIEGNETGQGYDGGLEEPYNV